MKAIVISTHGAPDVLHVTDLPDPVPARGRCWSESGHSV